MADIYIDRIDNLSCQESHGVVRSLSRKARIKFDASERRPNYDLLGATLDLLDLQGLGLFSTLSGRRYNALVLVRRSPALAENDPGVVDVVLEYQHVMDGPNQSGIAPAPGDGTGMLFCKGKTSVSDKTTNFYYPFGERVVNPDGTDNKRQILVAHKFPKWETGIAATPVDPNFPRVVFQGGEISLPFPASNISMQGIVITNAPQKIADDLVRTVNKVIWMNGEPAQWMCSEVTWEPNLVNFFPGNNPSAGSYKMNFEFQKNFDGWDPTVVFLDSRTGRPPANVEVANIPDPKNTDLNKAVDYYWPLPTFGLNGLVFEPPRPAGLWNVPALPRVDFDAYFMGVFQGGG